MPFLHRGSCTGYAYSAGDYQCPSDTGPIWKYYDNGWQDAGEGLIISCYQSNCSQDVPCNNGEGDCDDDSECAGQLVCGTDNCENGPRGLDCCTSTCLNDIDCVNQECKSDINQCRLDSYSTDWSKCSQESPCTVGEGDCDDHHDCDGTLLCGHNNCASGPFGMDCCTDAGNEKKIYFETVMLLYMC